MTNREFFVAISADESISAELRAKADELIASLDRKNDLRKSKPSKASVEAEARRMAVYQKMVPNTVYNRDEIAELAGCTPGQATSACTMLVKAGILTKIDAKGKSGKVTYVLTDESDSMVGSDEE